MSLRLQAAADAQAILEDSVGGFGWAVTVTDPSGTTGGLTGFTNDISQMIDPETGIAVTGRVAEVTLSVASLARVGLGIPKGVSDRSGKPWRVTFLDISGVSCEFKVIEGRVDTTLGLVICSLEGYTP